MPLYEYECEGCGHVFEVRATIKEKEIGLAVQCPACGSGIARQRLTFAALLHGAMSSSPASCPPGAAAGCCGGAGAIRRLSD